MRVLYVVTAFPRYDGDVITPWLLEEIGRLEKRGTAVSVFTSSYKGLAGGVFGRTPVFRFRYFFKRYENLTHEEMAADRFGRGFRYKLMSLCYVLFGLRAVYGHCRLHRYDIIHIHWPFPHIVFGYVAKKAHLARLVVTFYGAEVRWLQTKFRWLNGIVKYLLRQADSIIAISSHTAAGLKSLTDKPVTVIPFGAACQEGAGGEARDGQYILFVGRLVERKGVRFLIDAFSRIRELIRHRLVIVGDGPEKDNLVAQAARLGVSSRIVFAGRVSEHDLKAYYRNCTVFVNPSVLDKRGDTEMLGVVQLEAMTFGKPVIASRIGGIVDTVADEVNGLLVPPGDAASLAQAILRLAKNRALARRLGKKGRATVLEKFDWDRIVDRIAEVYEERN